MNSQDVEMIRALPDNVLWYIDDFIIKSYRYYDSSNCPNCDVYESECFSKLCPKVKKVTQKSVQQKSDPTKPVEDDHSLYASLMDQTIEQTFPPFPLIKSSAELEQLLLEGFDEDCTCRKPVLNSTFEKLVIAVEMFCRTDLDMKGMLTMRRERISMDNPSHNIEHVKEKIRHHAKWLLSDNPCSFSPERDVKFSDIIFISKSEFGTLLDKFISKVLDRDSKCSHEIAKAITKDPELSVVALFASRYRLTLYSAESMDFKFRKTIEEICEEMKLMGVETALKCVEEVGAAFCSGGRRVMNRFTLQKETIDILNTSARFLKRFLAGLLKEYKDFRRANPAGVEGENIQDYDIFCNPVYRQIFVLMEMRDRYRSLGLFTN